MEHLTLVSAASLQTLTRAQLFFTISPFRNSKARLGCLPSGLFLLAGDMVRARAETGPCGYTKGTIDCWALWVTLALGRGRDGEK